MRLAVMLLLCLPLIGGGCAKSSREPDLSAPPADVAAAQAPAAQKDSQGATPAVGKPAVDVHRVIRDATVEVAVPSYAHAATALAELAKQSGGYVSLAEVSHHVGDVSSATWVLRLPAPDLDAALAMVRQLGHTESEKITAEDVTEAWTDLGARLANSKAAELRLLGIMAQKTDDVADLLAVEKELARVRADIEGFQGKLKLLDNRIDFATLTLHLRVVEHYVPPVPTSLGSELAQTWSNSLENLRQFARFSLSVSVALVPWLALVFLPVVGLFRVLRPWRKRVKDAARGKE